MKRRTMRNAMMLIAMAGLVTPAVAQENSRPRRERDTTQKTTDEAPQRQTRDRQEGMTDEEMMARRKEALDRAVERGTLTRERADEMLERSKEQRERRTTDGAPGAARGGMNDALPAQINKLFDLQEKQHSEVNRAIRELRQKQMEVLRELRTGGGARGEGGSDARPPRRGEGDEARPERRSGGEGEARPERRERDEGEARPERRERDEGEARPERRERDEGEARPERRERDESDARPERRERDEGEARPERHGEGEKTDEAPLRGPRTDGAQGRGGPGERGAMSDDRRTEMLRLAREKMGPINRQFAKDLAGILGENQRTKLRENWESLDVMHPYVARMLEAEKREREGKKGGAKGEGKGKESKGKKDGARDGADKPAEPRGKGKGKGGKPGGG